MSGILPGTYIKRVSEQSYSAIRKHVACEQALRWGHARDSRAQGLNPQTSRGSLRNPHAIHRPLAPENLARDPNGELARRLENILPRHTDWTKANPSIVFCLYRQIWLLDQ